MSRQTTGTRIDARVRCVQGDCRRSKLVERYNGLNANEKIIALTCECGARMAIVGTATVPGDDT